MRITSTNQKATTAASTTRPASGTAVAPASGLGRRRIAGPGMVVWSNLISRARKPFGTRRAATPDVNRVLHRRRGAATYPLGGGYASGEIATGGNGVWASPGVQSLHAEERRSSVGLSVHDAAGESAARA